MAQSTARSPERAVHEQQTGPGLTAEGLTAKQPTERGKSDYKKGFQQELSKRLCPKM